MIARGMSHLSESAAGGAVSEYHLQAGIVAYHAMAKDYQSTDWTRILLLYDRLKEVDDSPVVALNRAVAMGNVHGPEAGLRAVTAIHKSKKLNSYYLLYAVLGEFERRLNHRQAAVERFRKAFELAETKSERAFLLNRMQECEEIPRIV
jgi:RNA polymerase sigma-70 factor (ECF subfamily)